MSLKQGTAYYDDWADDWEELPTTNSNNWATNWSEEEEEDVSPSTSRSRRNRGRQPEPESEEEDFVNGSTCSRCKSRNGNGSCCPCGEEFDEVHCALDSICDKVCDIQDSQEHQDACLGIIKGTT